MHGVVHGGLRPAELEAFGIESASVLDMSANCNPYGPCEAVVEAVRAATYTGYPDPACTAPRRALAAALSVGPERVVVGSGATELIFALAAWSARRAGRRRAPVVVAEPAFGEVAAACRAFGVPRVAVSACRERAAGGDAARPRALGGAPRARLRALGGLAKRRRAAWVYVCNPSTPDGAPIARPAMVALAEALAPIPLVVDESFLSLSDHHADAALPLPDHVIRLRSLTKDHALPGIRVGYALACPALVAGLDRVRPTWSVGAAAQAVATCALTHTQFLAESRARLQADRLALVQSLRDVGYSPFPSVAPYVAFPVGDAEALRRQLLVEHRVLVRDCASFGMPDVVRVAVRPEAQRMRLLAALRALAR